MSKHTPGPWRQNGFDRILGPDGGQIEATGLSMVVGYRDRNHPAFANARLIAAAPELLEALSVFVDFPPEIFAGDDDGAFTMTVRLRDMRAARAAIAKATGEEQ